MTDNEDESTVPTFTTGEEGTQEEGEALAGLGEKYGDGDDVVAPKGDSEDDSEMEEGGGLQNWNWRSSLRSTQPHKPLEEIESPWNPEEGGVKRVYRGIQKMAGVDESEAWVDIMVGLMEILYAAGNDDEEERKKEEATGNDEGSENDELEEIAI